MLRDMPRLCLAVLAGFAAVGLPTAGQAQSKPEQITIATANPGTPFAVIGAAMANIFSQHGVRSNTEQGGGVANPILVSEGRVDLGWTHTNNIPNFVKGQEPFKEPVTNLACIGGFNPAATHVLVRADAGVDSVKDLKGKPYATQPAGNTSTLALELLLAANGLSFDDLDISRGGQDFGANQTKDRKVVGFSATTGYPAAAFLEISQSMDVKFLDISDEELKAVQEMNEGFQRHLIPANTYNDQPDPIRTMGATSIVLTREDMPEEHVYWMLNTLAENMDDFKQSHSSLKPLTFEYMAETCKPLKLHAGAERFYREKGALN
jgi:TRAP transporter TAXI family solute receptor